MNRIVIGIPTYQRPEMLRNLVVSILACRVDPSLIAELSIMVIDNDIRQTAAQTISDLHDKASGKITLNYFNYPVKGLANVRNELLKRAFEQDPEFIVFIDDDEYVTTDWLNELVKTIIHKQADAVRGPVLAETGPGVSKYIKCWFKRERYPDQTQLFSLTTGNLIMRTSSLRKFNICFDPRFNTSGSEDGYFGIQILQKGAKIYWAQHAVTYEVIPESRTNLKWLMRRIYRTASTYAYFLRLENEYALILKKALVSVFYICSGCLALIILLSNYEKKYWGLLRIAEGIGGLSGLLNVTYGEYKSDNKGAVKSNALINM